MKRYVIGSWFGYILFLVCLCLLQIFHSRRILVFALMSMLVILLFSLCMLLKRFPVPRLTLQCDADTYQKGDRISVICKLQYPQYYPFARIKATYRICHQKEEKTFTIEDTYQIFHGIREYPLTVTLSYCGVYRIECEKICLLGPFALSARTIKDPVFLDLVVLPAEKLQETALEGLQLSEEEEADSPMASVDVSQIKELRDYRPGDALSQIHWKLSAKKGDLIVKEYEKLAGMQVALVCDVSYTDLASYTDYYEFLYAFADCLLAEEAGFEILYESDIDNDLVRRRVENKYEMTCAILDMYYHAKTVSITELVQHCKSRRGGSGYFALCGQESIADATALVQYHDVKLYAM